MINFAPASFTNTKMITCSIAKDIRNYFKLKRRSEMVADKLPDIMSGSIMFENILSLRVVERLVILVSCKIKGINNLDASKSKNQLVGLCSL